MELGPAVTSETESGLSIITLQSPRTRNALTPDTIDSVRSLVDEAFDDPSVRVVLFRAEGNEFCSGMDLGELTDRLPVDRPLLVAATESFASLLQRIHEGPKPVVAAVTGDLLAGGVGLAGACDLVYAIDTVGVQIGELVFGLIPANIMPVLIGRRLSEGAFRRMALTAERIDAGKAYRIGLIDHVAASSTELERALRALLRQLFRLHPGALRRTKELLREVAEADAATAASSAHQALVDLASDGETLEAIRAIEDGGTPPWFDRFRRSRPLLLREDS